MSFYNIMLNESECVYMLDHYLIHSTMYYRKNFSCKRDSLIIKKKKKKIKALGLHTVNVDIFAQLNFGASRPKRNIRVIKFFTHIPVNSMCSILMIIFAHITFSRI